MIVTCLTENEQIRRGQRLPTCFCSAQSAQWLGFEQNQPFPLFFIVLPMPAYLPAFPIPDIQRDLCEWNYVFFFSYEAIQCMK